MDVDYFHHLMKDKMALRQNTGNAAALIEYSG